MSTPVHVEIDGEIAWVTINNPPVNATSTSVRAGLLDAVGQVQKCKLAVLRCTGKTFVAGGDMAEFDAPPMLPHLPDVVNAIEKSTTPFVAILHGNVLGGGLEIAAGCAFRVAYPDTRFGLPEVNVGLIPGAGGTQRMPRLVGWDMAIEMACLGQIYSAEAMLAAGGIDVISDEPEHVIAQFIGKSVDRVSYRTIAPLPDVSIRAWEAKIAKKAKTQQSPLHNFEALKWAILPFADGQAKEREQHLRLREAPESKALRHIFFAERAVSKPSAIASATPKAISKVAIVGGGLMGSGIAAACLLGGLTVAVIEREPEAAEKARKTVIGILEGSVKQGKITLDRQAELLARLDVNDNYTAAKDADLAIEAVFENLEAKRAVFASLTNVMGPDAVLATNTSYLSPDEIFEGIQNQSRCVGIHFFSPAHIMKLVEVVRAGQTSPDVLASAFAFARGLRKTPVLSEICDGFIGNRILSAYRRAAEYLLADGALPDQVDRAMQAFGMAMGPFAAQDMAGLQIAEANRRRQDSTRNPVERYVSISDRLCAAKRYGQKTGAGWFSYEHGSKTPQIDDFVTQTIHDYSNTAGIVRRDFTDTEIQQQLLAAMANEGALIVEEGIAENDAAIDIVKTSGYGFPRWQGGPMFWASHTGHDLIGPALEMLEQASPGSWVVAKRFQTNSKLKG